jgi:hypothetical protein
MPFDRFYIGPYDKTSGLQTNVKPFLIPDEAFSNLINAYVFRGRVRKRFGSRWFGNTQINSRLRIFLGTTNAVTGNFAGFVPRNTVTNVPIATPAIGQMFSIADQVFTVVALGNPAVMLISGTATLATFDTTTGAVTINGAALNTAVYYYPALPVMGLLTSETNFVNNEQTYAFDTRFAYQYSNLLGGWERIAGETTPNAAYWLGDNSQFFWGTTWTGANGADKIFFVTNFNTGEFVAVNHPFDMRYLSVANLWTQFRPQIDAVPNYLFQARIIVPFKNRLVVFNTWEGPNNAGAINYQNRCRYSQIGDPTDVVNGWLQDVPGRGNAIDAATTESIITVEFIKDRLIVYFERSTWELVYTGNQIYPFVWQQINTELGAESTFSIIPFDKVAIGVGNVGIHACNGSNVERIDNAIPDTVFAIHNENSGVERVYGVRDYYVEMLYWTFPDPAADGTFPYPTRVLVYNYKAGTWAIFNDSITCFGYFQPQTGILWSSTTVTWSDEVIWGGGPQQSRFRQVIAGNQEGYTFICEADDVTNAPAIQITQIATANNIVTITAVDHNLRVDEFIYIQDVVDTAGNLTLLNDHIFKVIDTAANPITANSFSFIYPDNSVTIAGTYRGNGVIARVSKLTITTKEFNFYAKQNRNSAIQKVDFLVDATAGGQMIVEFFISSSLTPILQDSGPAGTGAIVGTGTLDTFPYPLIPLESTSERLYHPVYMQADGEYIQLQLTMSDEQMVDNLVRIADLQLHSMIITTRPTSDRLQ